MLFAMTRNSRARSGSRPTNLPPTKADLDQRERGRQAKAEAEAFTPEQRSLFNRQLVNLADLVKGGASKRDLAKAKKRFEEERQLLIDATDTSDGT